MLNEMQKEVFDIIKKRYQEHDIVCDKIISNIIETIVKDYSNKQCFDIIVNSQKQISLEDYFSQKL